MCLFEGEPEDDESALVALLDFFGGVVRDV